MKALDRVPESAGGAWPGMGPNTRADPVLDDLDDVGPVGEAFIKTAREWLSRRVGRTERNPYWLACAGDLRRHKVT